MNRIDNTKCDHQTHFPYKDANRNSLAFGKSFRVMDDDSGVKGLENVIVYQIKLYIGLMTEPPALATSLLRGLYTTTTDLEMSQNCQNILPFVCLQLKVGKLMLSKGCYRYFVANGPLGSKLALFCNDPYILENNKLSLYPYAKT